MQKTKILAVAPYEGMADILTDIAQSRDDIALTVQTGDLFTGRDIAMQLAHKNYDVIISRGGGCTEYRRYRVSDAKRSGSELSKMT